MGGLFSSPTPPTPPAPIAPPSKSDAEVKVAADKERKRLLAKKGRKSTIHTGGQGVLGAADVEKKKLLG
jgi:hypothetical protein